VSESWKLAQEPGVPAWSQHEVLLSGPRRCRRGRARRSPRCAGRAGVVAARGADELAATEPPLTGASQHELRWACRVAAVEARAVA
jgi:hypothetical protein